MSSAILEKIINDLADGEADPSVVQTLEVPEPAAVLDSLFRYCYPVVDPAPTRLRKVRSALEAATKYGISVAIQSLQKDLLSYKDSSPLEVYVIACKTGLTSIALKAAAAFITSEGAFLGQEYPELSSIPAHAYWNLMLCFRTSKSPTQTWSPTPTELYVHKNQSPGGNSILMQREICDRSSLTETQETSWASLPFDVSGTCADIVLRSSDGVNIKAHKWMLSFASPFFRGMFTLPQVDINIQEAPVVHVSESGEVFKYLITLIYPTVYNTSPPSFGVIYETLAAAQKYEMERPIAIIKDTLISSIQKSPVSVYLIACRYSFSSIAIDAARCALQKPLLDHTSKGLEPLERIDPKIDVNAAVLHRLIQYRTQYLHTMESTNWEVVASTDKNWTKVHHAFKNPCGGQSTRRHHPNTEMWSRSRAMLEPVAKGVCKSDWLARYGASAIAASKKGSMFTTSLEADHADLIRSAVRVGECSECAERAVVVLPIFYQMMLAYINSKIQKISIATGC